MSTYQKYANNKKKYNILCNLHEGGAKSNNINKINIKQFKKAFEYPFSFLKGGKNYLSGDQRYQIENFTLTMFNKNLKSENIDLNKINFPEDITEVYGYHEGKNDVDPWHFVGKIKYKQSYKYLYYIGEADNTGFDCQGSMKMYISKSLKRILKYAIEENTYHDLYKTMMVPSSSHNHNKQSRTKSEK